MLASSRCASGVGLVQAYCRRLIGFFNRIPLVRRWPDGEPAFTMIKLLVLPLQN